jgi:hypothetical protein
MHAANELERIIQIALADPAPGANQVESDIDFEN